MAYLKKMQNMFAKGEYAELNIFCKEKLEFTPEDVDLLFFYASTLNSLGKHKEARNAFHKLFIMTQDRLFLTCESIPEFDEFDREGALKSLAEAIKGEKSVDNLFIAFEVAFANGEVEMARQALYFCFRTDSRKTVSKLQEFFEKKHIKDPEKRIMVVEMLATLKRILKV